MFNLSKRKSASRSRKLRSTCGYTTSYQSSPRSWALEPLEDRRLLAVNAFGDDTALIGPVGAVQERPDISMNAAGEYVVAWDADAGSSSKNDVFARVYNADGTDLVDGQGLVVGTITLASGPNVEARPSIAIGVDKFVAVWEEVIDATQSSIKGRYVEWGLNGISLDLQFDVASNIDTSDFPSLLDAFPTVAMDSSGEFAVGWYEGTASGDTDVFVQWYSVGVKAQSSHVTVNPVLSAVKVNDGSGNGGLQVGAEVAMRSNGDFVVVWGGPDIGGSSDIYARRFSAGVSGPGPQQAPQPITGEFKVNTSDFGVQRFAGVDMASDGTIVVAWHAGSIFGTRVNARVIEYDGVNGVNVFKDEFRVDDTSKPLPNTLSPSVKFSADSATNDEFTIVYNFTGTENDIALAVYKLADSASDADGVEVVRAAFQANQTVVGDQRTPVAVVGAEGDIVVAWSTDSSQIDTRKFAKARVVNALDISEGESLVLDATPRFLESTVTGTSALTYKWDVDGVGGFNDGTGSVLTLTWQDLVALGINDNQTLNVQVEVTGPLLGASVSAVDTVDILNVAPTALATGPPTAVRGETVSFTLTATDPSPADQASNFTFSVDWDNDGNVDETFVGPSGMTVEHLFQTDGLVNVSVQATDKDGGLGAEALTPIDVKIWETRVEGSLTSLFVGGTAANEGFSISDASSNAVNILVTDKDTQQTLVNINTTGITGRVVVYAQGGDDDLTAPFLNDRGAELYGQAGNDLFLGSKQDDTLFGGAGNDALIGVFFGGTGNDLLYGDDGDDTLYGAAGNDTLYGGAGNDILLGDGTLLGAAGNDALFGGDGNDTLDGGAGNDLIEGNNGDDTIIGGEGNDALSGGAGDDVYLFGRPGGEDLGIDTLTDGIGANDDAFDGVFFSDFGTGVNVNLEYVVSTDKLVNMPGILELSYTSGFTNTIEVVSGTLFGDTITGNAKINFLTGRDGDDSIMGGGGDDLLWGDLGDDTLSGGAGDDTYLFDREQGTEDLGSDLILEASGAQNDAFDMLDFSAFGAPVTVDLGITTLQTVYQDGGGTPFLKITLSDGNPNGGGDVVEVVQGSAFNDVLKGNSRENILVGGAGDDSLQGMAGRDLLLGGLGADTLDGGADEDLLLSGDVNFGGNERDAIIAIMTEWTSARSYADRIANISGTGTGTRNNGNFFLDSNTLVNDSDADTLTGGPGIGVLDWYLYDLLDDSITDKEAGETATEL